MKGVELKLRTNVVEESNEYCFWLELLVEAHLLPPRRLDVLLDEANHLAAIMVASRKTAISRKDQT